MSTYSFDITNYQIIKNAHLQFRPGLTLITGKSNNGKSSIFKAFQQLIYNTPGSKFISHNKPSTTLSLHHPDYDIVYTKSTSQSSYTITTPTDHQQYTKLGQSQHPHIASLTHINKDLNYNFWSQLEKPFLISLPPRNQFDLIQNSPHSTTINNCLQQITQDRKQQQLLNTQLQSKIEILQQQNQQYSQQLSSLPTISQLHDLITSLTPQHEFITNITSLNQQYTSIDLTPISLKLSTLHNIPSTDHLSTQLQSIQSIQKLYNSLLHTTKPINDTTYQIKQIDTTLTTISHILSTKFTICPLCNQPIHQIHNNT